MMSFEEQAELKNEADNEEVKIINSLHRRRER